MELEKKNAPVVLEEEELEGVSGGESFQVLVLKCTECRNRVMQNRLEAGPCPLCGALGIEGAEFQEQ